MDDPLSGRGYIWRETLSLLGDTWLIGRGPGTFEIEFPQETNPAIFGSDYVNHPHNIYLQIAHQSGNISALLFIVGLGYFCWRAWRSGRSRAVAAMAGVVGYAVAGLVDSSFVGVSPVFWVILGAGVACL